MPPSKKTIGFSELRVGLLVLGSIIVLIFLILNATGDINPFATKLHLRARLPNASGLREGSEVRLAGVTVGKVDNIQLLPPTDDPNAPKVEVRLAVNNKIDGQAATNRIRKDSTAQLDSPGLLGNEKIINVTPGTSIVEPVPENFLLPTSSAGGIPELTASGNELMGRLNKISDQVNGIVTKINNGEGSLGRAITDEALYNNLNSTIRETQDVIRQIRTGEGSAGKLLNDPALYNNANQIALQLSAISKDLQAGRGTAGKLLTDEALYNKANSTIDRLDQSINQINGLVGEVRAGRGTVGKLLTDEAIYNDARAAIARFNITAERIDNVVATAQRGEGTMGKLLTDN